MPTPLNLTALDHALGALASAFTVRWEESVPSTNAALIEHPPADDGRVFVLGASAQTAGRGRRGRRWLAWAGGSLTFSVLWRFAPGAPVPAGLSLVTGLALARALEKLGVSGIALKWPNDVLVQGRKIAGVLIELSTERDRRVAAVIGIGLNLRLPPEATIPDQPGGVTDLACELGAAPPQESVLAAVLAELHPLLTLYASAGFPLLRQAWQQHNAFADLPVRITSEGGEIVGRCVGVDDDGALLVDSGNGIRRVLAGDVSLRQVS
jgi:BirA family biotin operon repressor/biotin-[acetyl-CoA-carboxylase] ligase